MVVLKNKLFEEIYNHPGFPTADQVFCYIFLQDKLGYIEKAPQFFLPSHRVELAKFDSTDIATLIDIEDFLNRYPDSTFVVKTGFSTNCHINSLGCADKDSVYKRLTNLCREHLSKGTGQLKLPYAFIQKKVKNHREVKLLFFNGKFQYIHKRLKGTKRFQKPEINVIDLAKTVIEYYRTHVPEVISQYIIRVDIMETDEGELFVNELESLAADISHVKGTQNTAQVEYMNLKNSLRTFYKDIVVKCVSDHILKRRRCTSMTNDEDYSFLSPPLLHPSSPHSSSSSK